MDDVLWLLSTITSTSFYRPRPPPSRSKSVRPGTRPSSRSKIDTVLACLQLDPKLPLKKESESGIHQQASAPADSDPAKRAFIDPEVLYATMVSLEIFLLHEDAADFLQSLVGAMGQESGLEPRYWYEALLRSLAGVVHSRVLDIWNCSCFDAFWPASLCFPWSPSCGGAPFLRGSRDQEEDQKPAEGLVVLRRWFAVVHPAGGDHIFRERREEEEKIIRKEMRQGWSNHKPRVGVVNLRRWQSSWYHGGPDVPLKVRIQLRNLRKLLEEAVDRCRRSSSMHFIVRRTKS